MEGKLKGNIKTVDVRKLKKGDSLNYVLDVAKLSFKEKIVLDVFHNAQPSL
jgi:hypothetical protein